MAPQPYLTIRHAQKSGHRLQRQAHAIVLSFQRGQHQLPRAAQFPAISQQYPATRPHSSPTTRPARHCQLRRVAWTRHQSQKHKVVRIDILSLLDMHSLTIAAETESQSATSATGYGSSSSSTRKYSSPASSPTYNPIDSGMGLLDHHHNHSTGPS